LSKGLVEKITDIFKPQAPLWACELTPRHIIIAGVNHTRNVIRAKIASALPAGTVASSYSEPNIRNADLARSSVKQLLSEAGFTGSEITLVVPDDMVRIAFLTADNRSKNSEERETFIRWKLKKTVPFDVDSAQIAYRIVGSQPGSTAVDMIVALSPRTIVEEYENLFDSLDIHAGMVAPSTLAALNLFTAPAADTLILKVTPDCVTTTVFKDGRIQFYRRVADASSLYDAAYPTVMYYQDKLGGSGLKHLFVCGYEQDVRMTTSELQEKLGLIAQRIEPMSVDDIFKPVLGSVHLAWQNLI
jgi:type IV pilus assembly protein PilM